MTTMGQLRALGRSVQGRRTRLLRNQLPEFLTAAQGGRQTIITRHGRPVAVLSPISGSGEANAYSGSA